MTIKRKTNGGTSLPTAAIVFTMIISIVYLIVNLFAQNSNNSQFIADIRDVKTQTGIHANKLSTLDECARNQEQSMKRIETKLDKLDDLIRLNMQQRRDK